MSDIAVRILSFLRLVRRYWLSLAVMATLFHLIFVHVASGSVFRRSIAKITNTSQVFGRYIAIDNLFNEAAGNANVFLSFLDSDSVEPKVFHKFADPIRLRGTYCLYPRRVCLGPPELVEAADSDSQKIKFAPDVAWLKANHVAGMVVFRCDKETGAVTWETSRVE